MEVTIGGNSYQTGKLTAFQQFHVARRFLPLVSGLGGVVAALKGKISEGEVDKVALVTALGPIADVLAQMKDEECDYVLKLCLSVCKRQQGQGAWAPVTTLDGQLMFQDMDMPAMVQLVSRVVQENLGSFFTGKA